MQKRRKLVKNKISPREAFDAMSLFLEDFYNKTDSDDVGSLLSEIQFCSDNSTMDPAAWYDWLNCLTKVSSTKREACILEDLSYIEAFKSMVCFLENYFEHTSSDDVGSLLRDLQFLEDGGTADPAAWEDWLDCVIKVTKPPSPEKEDTIS